MLPLISPHSASAPESHLRLQLGRWRLPAVSLDHDVYASNGRLLGCSEFAYPEYRVALEYEGDHHRTLTSQWDRDIEKHRDYARAGWDAIRVTSRLLHRRPDDLHAQIREALGERGWRAR